MTSAKQDSATYNMTCLLREWDRSPKEKRRQLLQDFIDQHWNRSGPELELELAQMASLFLARICVWVKLTYMTGTCLTEQLQVLYIFLSAASSHHFLTEFLQNGGVLCLQELCVFDDAKEIDRYWALKVLSCVANGGTRYKETICECYGIRAVAECMAKSHSVKTQEAARDVLELLAEGNPRFRDQVYKGLIAVLPCDSAKAQQLALQSIRILQARRRVANRALIDRVICILESLHLEVQSAALELVRDLMSCDIAEDILKALVALLRPQREIQLGKLFAQAAKLSDDSSQDSDEANDKEADHSHGHHASIHVRLSEEEEGAASRVLVARPTAYRVPHKRAVKSRYGSRRSLSRSRHHRHGSRSQSSKSRSGSRDKTKTRAASENAEALPSPVFVQQAASAKCIRVLMQDSRELTKSLLKMGALSGLLYAMGNLEFTDSQRQASLAVHYLCAEYPPIKDLVSHIMGSTFYEDFEKNTDSFFLRMSPLQADLLVSNKVKLTVDVDEMCGC
ncbi:hypothetical protein AAHC03_013522 [Spirometra sp. Aus1]|nr:unnamed protein product [Spirometra erinaceieuropaei]